ncbi:MAG: IS630 family transposase [Minicystis sp.]
MLGEHLRQNILWLSNSTVQRILRDAQLQPHRQKMWLTSQDDEFRSKRDDVLRVYYDAPVHEHIICVDEKTSIQALERCTPDLPMSPGEVIRREFEYIRHGTLCLMGAFDVRRGKLFGFTSPGRSGPTFIQLLELVDACYPTGRGHIICDNLSDHDTDDVIEWFEEHPRWTRHFTPKHASWLNRDRMRVLLAPRPRAGAWLLRLVAGSAREALRVHGLAQRDGPALHVVVPAEVLVRQTCPNLWRTGLACHRAVRSLACLAARRRRDGGRVYACGDTAPRARGGGRGNLGTRNGAARRRRPARAAGA